MLPTKKCVKCRETKPLSEFSKDSSKPDGLTYWCKACLAEACASYEARLKTWDRTWTLQHEYSVTPEEYDQMLEAQNGRCAICGKTPIESGRRLRVDHCHETGKIRGLLCPTCGQVLCLMASSSERLARAITYLNNAARR